MKIPPLIFIFAGILLQTTPCLAYVDPNTGGWLFQMLFPVLVSLGGLLLLFKARLIRLVRTLFKSKHRHH